MMTSTFLPAALPPAPPPVELDELPDARPPTTPTTSAMSAMTATSDSENFTRRLLMSPATFSLWTLFRGAPQPRGNVFSSAGTVRKAHGAVKRIRLLDGCVYTSHRP